MAYLLDLPAPTISTERKSLKNPSRQLGTNFGFGFWGMLAFGLPFVAAGVFMVLVANAVILPEENLKTDQVWMMNIAGVVFALGGFMCWAMAVRGYRAEAYRRRARREHPHEPCLHDHPWDPGGETFDHWAPAMKAVGGFLFMALFLSMFNYWAFFTDDSNWFVVAIVGIFDLILVLVLWEAVTRVVRALRFGPGRVRFHQFPYRVGEPVVLSWAPSSRFDDATKATAELRCIHEYWITTGTGKNRSRRMVHDRVWSQTYDIPPAVLPKAHTPLDLEFHPPADAPPTQISADQPDAWQLVITIQRPGVDLIEEFLIPIYAPPTASSTAGF